MEALLGAFSGRPGDHARPPQLIRLYADVPNPHWKSLHLFEGFPNLDWPVIGHCLELADLRLGPGFKLQPERNVSSLNTPLGEMIPVDRCRPSLTDVEILARTVIECWLFESHDLLGVLAISVSSDDAELEPRDRLPRLRWAKGDHRLDTKLSRAEAQKTPSQEPIDTWRGGQLEACRHCQQRHPTWKDCGVIRVRPITPTDDQLRWWRYRFSGQV